MTKICLVSNGASQIVCTVLSAYAAASDGQAIVRAIIIGAMLRLTGYLSPLHRCAMY